MELFWPTLQRPSAKEDSVRAEVYYCFDKSHTGWKSEVASRGAFDDRDESRPPSFGTFPSSAAKFMKRPVSPKHDERSVACADFCLVSLGAQTKAEKVSRKVTAPATSKPATRVRSQSPEDAVAAEHRLPIPLFNTSAKNRGNGRQLEKHRAAAQHIDTADDVMNDNVDDGAHLQDTGAASATFDTTFPATSRKALAFKDKMRQAKEQMRIEEEKRKAKFAAGGAGGTSARRRGHSGVGASSKDKFKLGTDYVALHESRPGGAFKKKMR
ncbi:hypothetical protein OIV83_006311 [Microbotryomycetes sp. JL201]|nr:hypothetical protein OIV83_006311 [Microbotryomycetes sp. JL201]